jgi:hypothetical protein
MEMRFKPGQLGLNICWGMPWNNVYHISAAKYRLLNEIFWIIASESGCKKFRNIMLEQPAKPLGSKSDQTIRQSTTSLVALHQLLWVLAGALGCSGLVERSHAEETH